MKANEELYNAVFVAVCDFVRNGGSVSDAEDTLKRILNQLRVVDGELRPKLLPGNGQKYATEKGQMSSAEPGQANRDGAGQHEGAENGRFRRARPVREPTEGQLTAAKKVATKLAAIGWLGEARIPGGPRYVDLRVRDLPGIYERQLNEGAAHARSAIAVKIIQKEIEAIGQVQPDALWVDILPKKRIKEISEATETEVLKPMAVGWLRGFNESAQTMLLPGNR